MVSRPELAGLTLIAVIIAPASALAVDCTKWPDSTCYPPLGYRYTPPKYATQSGTAGYATQAGTAATSNYATRAGTVDAAPAAAACPYAVLPGGMNALPEAPNGTVVGDNTTGQYLCVAGVWSGISGPAASAGGSSSPSSEGPGSGSGSGSGSGAGNGSGAN